jgi:predicted nucleic acid-binding protein
MIVLLDTDVVLDVLLARQPWVSDAQAVFEANERGQVDAWVTATTLTNLYYLCRKSIGREAALDGVHACLAQFQIASVDTILLQAALHLHGPDFEDDLQIVCAQAAGADTLVTRNVSHFRHSPILVLTPSELVKRIGV